MVAVALAAVFLAIQAGIVHDGLTDRIGPADVGIVLANAVRWDGRPSERLQARLDKAVELYRQGRFPIILVSGGVAGRGHNEAVVMRAYLLEQGIPEDRILVDATANNTYLTAQHAAAIMRERGMRRAMVITQYFHITRTKLALRRFGVAPAYSAHADIFELRDLYSAPREVAALGYYVLRSYGP